MRILLGVVLIGYPAIMPATPVIGWLETVSIVPDSFKLRARMDTGAKNASIDARDIQIQSRDGKQYISFLITNKRGKTILLERPLIRYAKVRQDSGEPQIRPVIELTICVGNIKKAIEVNINDRSNLNYPMLIGRSYLSGSYLVDSSKTFTTRPGCK